MSSRKFLVILLATVFVIGAVGSAYGYGSYLTPLSAACPGTSCTSCHGPSGPPLTAYGTSFSNISTHSSNPAGAIATLGCPGSTPAACTGYTYSAWSPATCPSSGQQTRTATKAPAGCTGTPSTAPVLTQSCTPAPVACTGYTYSAWSPATCPSSGQQTRTAVNAPAGCTGTPPTAAVLTQACTPATIACTDYTYSAWSPAVCPESGQQTRTAVNAPAGCTGTPPTAAVLTQACNYVPPVTPPPTSGTMPVPAASTQVFSYEPLEQPAASTDPNLAKPIGVGPVATGGDTADVSVQIGPFAGPVNVSFMIYAPTIESEDLYFMTSGNVLKRLSKAVEEDEQSDISGQDSDSEDDLDDGQSTQSPSKFGKLARWKNNVTGVSESIFKSSVEDLPSGVYVLVLVVKSTENDHNYYRWITHINIP